MCLRRKIIFFLIDALLLSVFITLFERLIGAWSGYPVGWDAYNALTRLRFVMEYFPHINWSPFWSGGMPLFLWYPPLPYLILSAVIGITSWTTEFALTFAATLSIALVGIAIYGLIMEVTRCRSVSMLMSAVAVTTPSFLHWHIAAGLYSRVLATPFLVFSIWVTLVYAKKVNSGEGSKSTFTLILIFLSLAVQSHTLVGVVSAFSTLVILLFNIRELKNKLVSMCAVSLSTFFLSAYFYVPFFFFISYSNFSGLLSLGTYPIGLEQILYPLKKGVSESLSPFLVPLAVPLTAFFLLKPQKKIVKELASLSVVPLGIMLYFLSVVMGARVRMFHPAELLYFVPLFLAPAVAILLHSLFSDTKWRKISIYALAFAFFLWVSSQYPVYGDPSPVVRGSYYGETLVSDILTGDGAAEWNYRFGINHAGFAGWFNFRYPALPQTKNYYSQGDINPHFNYYFETETLRTVKDGMEVKFLFDWWGVKWFVADSRWDHPEKFLEATRDFNLLGVGEGGNLYGFKFKDASPILSASNAPVALFIGSEEAYHLFFKTLALSNFNSKHFISVYGGAMLDDLRLEDLKRFDLVILYGYDYRYQEEAFPILKEYVSEGGRLLMFTDLSKDWSCVFLPEPAPIWRTEGMAFGTEWNFSYPSNEYTDNINFSRFAPAIYGNGPWGYSGTYISDLKEGATVILSNHGQPVVVERDYGDGKVIWCGLNLPLHIVSYENTEESRFLVNLIKENLPENEVEPKYEAMMINPEQFDVKLQSQSKGVLFKECYFPNWKAYLKNDETTRLRIYKAGPNFMYVKLPENSAHSTVQFRYTKSLVQWLGDLIFISSFFMLIIYASPIGNRAIYFIKSQFSHLRI